MSTSTKSTSVILGIGNPLLDISAHVDQAFLDKYDVKLNNAILAEAAHQPLYADLIKSYPVEYIAGGATQNSIRVAQWMLQQAGATTYLGCVGNDEYGKVLQKSAEGDGVHVLYDVNQEHPTGTCAVLIHDKERSLIANLAAANHFKQSHLSTPVVADALSSVKIVYSAGFFLTVSPPSLMEIAALCDAKNKFLAVNISAPFIAQFFADKLNAAIEYADFVFGNESEAEAWAKQQGKETNDIGQIALLISAFPSKRTGNRHRTAVITQGSKSTVVASQGKVTEFTVPPLDKSLIVDSNGAGDAFVGGFLSQLALSRPVEKCVEAGHYAARCIIQVSGCKLVGKPDFQ